MSRFFLMTGSILGLLSVALGAFAAHVLRSRLDEYSMGVFRTGIDYQFYHTFAILLTGVLLISHDITKLNWSGYAFLLGVILFSGSLYALAFTGIKGWGMVTPIGGVCFLLGWVLFIMAAIERT